MHFPCNMSSVMKVLKFPRTIALQRLQIELRTSGGGSASALQLQRDGRGMSAYMRCLTLPISSRTMSCFQLVQLHECTISPMKTSIV